ncbi:hypothetical protein GCM10009347_11530 [Shewanella algicola]|uniref:Tetratricopeptide repeat protein n=1 Tax=Shewanella algicola TaxID=640633 RepID=A0A9X2CCX0_9GAMM|nr:hypothetical protein [Shewanella algicola]MCL1106058.1 hypothetical protein [Shewanella algicola]GGP45854.1 hypothetical protein GCM10009347_11530 [Shewanella algicola]
MSSDDWYRNKDWNESIEENFYSKLKRARSQRDQYLVIQALTLTERHPEISLRLVDEYFESRKDQYDDVRALLAKADALIALDNLEKGISAYQEILERERDFPNHQTGVYLDYPYLVATKKIENEYANALNVLNEHIDRLTFPLDYYKWHASKALINNDGSEAKKALDAAEVKKSGFSFHQNVGLVGKEHERTIKRLCKISKTWPPTPSG